MNPQTQMPATVVSKSLDHGDEWAVVDVEMRCAPRISVMQDALWSAIIAHRKRIAASEIVRIRLFRPGPDRKASCKRNQ